MILQFRLTRADLDAGLRLHHPGRASAMVVGIVACVSLILLGVVLLLAPATPAVQADLRKWGTVSSWLGVALLAMMLSQAWTLRRALSRRAAAEELTHIRVEAEGLQAEARGARSTIEWSRVCRFVEGRRHFLLYRTPEQYFIFPKSAFASPDEIGSFRELARQSATRSDAAPAVVGAK
jgi:hypothetical protein